MVFFFDWDPPKARANERKHGVGFEEAQTIFYDQNGIDMFDDEHSKAEDRFVRLGLSDRGRLLVAVYTSEETEFDTLFWLISARIATRSEVTLYLRG